MVAVNPRPGSACALQTPRCRDLLRRGSPCFIQGRVMAPRSRKVLKLRVWFRWQEARRPRGDGRVVLTHGEAARWDDEDAVNRPRSCRPRAWCIGTFGERSQAESLVPRDRATMPRRILLSRTPALSRAVLPWHQQARHRSPARRPAWQLGGSSSSGGFGFGKLWLVSEMTKVRIIDETFLADDPDYNPNDSAMARIHCRI
jgi:hypothetical protein